MAGLVTGGDMPAVATTISETAIFTALRAFLLQIVDVEVVRGLDNRVPMPAGEFVTMSPGSDMALATPETTYTEGVVTIKQSTQYSALIDCYGAASHERARTICTLMRTALTCDLFPADIQPLYAGDPRQMPLISGEEQYVERWSFDAVLQYNPRVSVPQESATQLNIGLVNVPSTYP